jgi:hypothetical protein
MGEPVGNGGEAPIALTSGNIAIRLVDLGVVEMAAT